MYPPGTVPPPEPSAQKRRRRWPIVVLALLLLVGIFLVVDFVFLAGSPSYRITAGRYPNSVGPTAVQVGFAVKNTGTVAGTPTCTVRVKSITGSSKGSRTLTENPVEPGKGAIFIGSVPVTTGNQTTIRTWTVAVACV